MAIEKKHIIDCDANPCVPNGWKVEEHIKGGQLHWNPDEVELYFSDEQKSGSIEGNKLRKLLKDKPVLNACVLDYLPANWLIPKEWKGEVVFFWGTIYRDSFGYLCVRCLDLGNVHGRRWNFFYLDNFWFEHRPAALSRK